MRGGAHLVSVGLSVAGLLHGRALAGLLRGRGAGLLHLRGLGRLHLGFDGLGLLQLADGAVVVGPLRAVVGLAVLGDGGRLRGRLRLRRRRRLGLRLRGRRKALQSDRQR